MPPKACMSFLLAWLSTLLVQPCFGVSFTKFQCQLRQHDEPVVVVFQWLLLVFRTGTRGGQRVGNTLIPRRRLNTIDDMDVNLDLYLVYLELLSMA